MITVYLSFNGNTREALDYYVNIFNATDVFIMSFSDMPEDPDYPLTDDMKDLIAYSNFKTFAGEISMSDNMPGTITTPNESFWISVESEDEEELRRTFNSLAADGEIIMPMAPTFFSPLYGQVKDKYGFYWMFLIPDESMYNQ